ncbi:hypothetical protein DSOL_0687 [Desulfosporosinus metallidurans]|uniref:Uncharacterized protein n=1 Tax=Desulfosporosinus metallidurans TaxID=1888891 RepID=A0A1Q8R1N8_9FIRM|nr:hypothetical protein DSOL_0687 [Desulfosporosinus metallidurans]
MEREDQEKKKTEDGFNISLLRHQNRPLSSMSSVPFVFFQSSFFQDYRITLNATV